MKADNYGKPVTTLIIGLQGSGASGLSDMLSDCGAWSPADPAAGMHKNRENLLTSRAIVGFHERLPKTLESSSTASMSLPADWLTSMAGRAAITELTNLLKYRPSNAPLSLITDPRLYRFIPLWRTVLKRVEHEPVAILPIRHPARIAKVMAWTSGLPRLQAVALWLQSVLIAEHDTRGLARCFVQYDEQFAEQQQSGKRVIDQLDLRWPKRAGGTDKDDVQYPLQERHQSPSAGPEHTGAPVLDALSESAWTALTTLTEVPDEPQALAALDAIRTELEQHLELASLLASSQKVPEQHGGWTPRKIGSSVGITSEISTEHTPPASNGHSAELHVALDRIHALENSLSWKITRPFRSVCDRLFEWQSRRIERRTKAAIHDATGIQREGAPTHRARGGDAIFCVTFVSGGLETPGHRYYIEDYAETARQAGHTVNILSTDDIPKKLELLRRADLIWIWRAPWDKHIEMLFDTARKSGGRTLFCIDDLMFDPDLATSQVIDGIRNQVFDETNVSELFARIRRTAFEADYAAGSTTTLGSCLRYKQERVFVTPNGFNDVVYIRSRRAVRYWQSQRDRWFRIGYAAGTATHQRDFAQCANAVALILRAYPHTCLVVFRSGDMPLLDLREFPVFDGLGAQIEWRDAVPLECLPDELARFDISIAPLEVGNPFCEAKTALKYFESALVDVPVIASPTASFKEVVCDGETGLLAGTEEDWYRALSQLIEDAALRESLIQNARYAVLSQHGPDRRMQCLRSVIEQTIIGGRAGAQAFELDMHRRARSEHGSAPPALAEHRVVFEHDALGEAWVTVIIPLHNYAHYIQEALDSVDQQTTTELDLIVVDDGSTDRSLDTTLTWAKAKTSRFNRLLVLSNTRNVGLARTRNIGFDRAETPYVIPLDADNRLRPDFTDKTLTAARRSGADFVYTQINQFGGGQKVMGLHPYEPVRLVGGNSIDAMSLIRKSCWARVGGYRVMCHPGWEDYDFWCRAIEEGLVGEHVKEALAEYRVHPESMLATVTETPAVKPMIIEEMQRNHPWLQLRR